MPSPIYIVSGFPRSGTSMMMRALEEGGIPAVYDISDDEKRNRTSYLPDYVPNPHGFYEAGLGQLKWEDCRGKVVKATHDDISFIPRDERVLVVYMKRNPEEIRRSYVGIMGFAPVEDTFNFLDGYEEKVEGDTSLLRSFAESVLVFSYADVVKNPFYEFEKLREAGWPISVSDAARVVDANLYRNRVA